MKPTSTVADFIRRGREAGQDALGLAHDPEAIVAMAAVQRETFLRQRTEASLRRWRDLVSEAAASGTDEPAVARWLGIEHVRLGRAFEALALEDTTLLVDAARWTAVLLTREREEIVSRFDLDFMAPLTAAAAGSRG